MLHLSRKLFDNLYCYIWSGHGNNSHTYLFPNVLRGERPHIVVDPGFVVNETYEDCLNSLIDAMARDGFKLEDTGLIINTHTHPDHCQATETIVERSTRAEGKGKINKAVVALHKDADDYYKVAGERMFNMFGMKVVKLDPLIHLAEGELSLGRDEKQVSLTVIYTPGHSADGIVLYNAAHKILISFDALWEKDIPVMTLRVEGSRTLFDVLDSLEKIRRPGKGGQTESAVGRQAWDGAAAGMG